MSKKYKFLIVASNFYPKITNGLLSGAISELKKHKCIYDLYKVNGSLEIPVQVSILLKKKKYDAVIAVGCIIKGKTDHYEFIAQAITNSLLSISIDKSLLFIPGTANWKLNESSVSEISTLGENSF